MKVLQAIKYFFVILISVFDKFRNSKHDIDESEMKDRVPVTGSDQCGYRRYCNQVQSHL